MLILNDDCIFEIIKRCGIEEKYLFYLGISKRITNKFDTRLLNYGILDLYKENFDWEKLENHIDKNNENKFMEYLMSKHNKIIEKDNMLINKELGLFNQNERLYIMNIFNKIMNNGGENIKNRMAFFIKLLGFQNLIKHDDNNNDDEIVFYLE